MKRAWGAPGWSGLRRHALDYVSAGGCLLAGAIVGALAVGGIGAEARGQVVGYLQDAVLAPSDRWPGGSQVFARALELHAGTAGLLWVGGFFAAGLALVPLVLFARGFTLGFAAGFLVYEGGWPGLLIAGTAMLPAQLVALPIWLGLGGTSLRSAYALSVQRLGGARVSAGERAASFVPWLPVAGAAVLLASLLDAYLAPAALRAVLNALQL